MGKTTIEQQFGAAMRFVRTLHERGFQARVSEHVGMQSSNLSEIITKDKGTFETTRRAVFEECVKLTPSLCGMTYETFLRLGDLILSGLSGEEALERARGMAAGNYVLPKLRIKGTARVVQNCAGSVVNNGVMSVGDEAPVAPAVSGGEIVKDVSEMIAKYLEGKSLDEQIEFRAEIKRLIVGRSGTNDAAKTPHGGPYMLVTTEFVSPEGPRMMRRDTDCTADMERQKE